MLTIRAVQIVLWMLVLSGPVAVLVVATRISSVGDRLDALHTAAVVEVPPDTSGVEGFAELFIAAYLGAGEDSTSESPKRSRILSTVTMRAAGSDVFPGNTSTATGRPSRSVMSP
jgi:hypothetical protein